MPMFVTELHGLPALENICIRMDRWDENMFIVHVSCAGQWALRGKHVPANNVYTTTHLLRYDKNVAMFAPGPPRLHDNDQVRLQHSLIAVSTELRVFK